MKTYKNLYSRLCSFENLCLAFEKCRRRKRYKEGVPEFEYNLEKEIFEIKEELESFSFKPQPPKVFLVRDPKRRVIHATSFKERVIHHALCNIIEPIFDKTFIFDSYACRKEKGTHAAIERFDIFKRKTNKNNTKKCYILKADIKKYFDSIDHEILLSLIGRKIKDEKVMWLITQIVRQGNGNTEGRGMPIGNLTSQLFANIYLNELDHFVKQQLKIKHYVRYVDDVVVLNSSIDYLFWARNQMQNFLEERLNLNFHPKKTFVMPLDKGLDLLGYRIFYFYKLLRENNLQRFKKRLRRLKYQYEMGSLPLEKLSQSIVSWTAHAKHANSYKLRRRVLGEVRFVTPKEDLLEFFFANS